MYYRGNENESFNKMSDLLSRKGIHNNQFMNVVHNGDLTNPEVWKTDEEKKEAIAVECTQNLWYFLKYIARVPGNQDEDQKYMLNEANMEMLYALSCRYSVWVTSPRQSLVETTIIFWLIYRIFLNPINDHLTVRIISKNRHSAEYFKHRIKLILTLLPKYIIGYEVEPIMSRFNICPCNSLITAMKLKSDSADLIDVFLDAEFIPYVNEIYVDSHRSIFTSTISDDADVNGALDIIKYQSIPFVKEIYDDVCLKNREDFTFPLIYIQKQFCELGYTFDEWIDRCESLNWDEDIIRRELLLRRK